MLWFNRNKEQPETPTESAERSSVRVAVHKNARKEVVAEAKKVNAQLEKLVADNHFTITILLAAGAKTKKRVIKNGH